MPSSLGYQFGSAYQQLTAHAGLFVLAAGVGGSHPVLVEQMAAGNAILARETASDREVLGDAGLFWSTPEELGQLLREMWPDADRRRRLGECAQQRASERYSWEAVTTRIWNSARGHLPRASSEPGMLGWGATTNSRIDNPLARQHNRSA
jgi:glycosyltransferase involved in cell wall biosynthesis